MRIPTANFGNEPVGATQRLTTVPDARNGATRILSGEVNINFGAIYESVVAQELLAQGFEQLYYFNSKKQSIPGIYKLEL